MRISDWSSDVCSSDLIDSHHAGRAEMGRFERRRRDLAAPDVADAERGDDHRADGARAGDRRHSDRGARGEVQLACEFARSEEHTSELQSLMRISYAVFCLKKKKTKNK